MLTNAASAARANVRSRFLSLQSLLLGYQKQAGMPGDSARASANAARAQQFLRVLFGSVSEPTQPVRACLLLKLSPAGEAVLRQVEPAIRRVQERLLAPLSASESKTIVSLLAKMADAAGAEDDE
jgi:hypothetical protein